MFLGAYHFDGSPDALLDSYRQLLQSYPLDSIDLQVCVRRDTGITIYDACPSKEVHREFSRSPEFLGALAAVGFPVPRVEPIGDVQAARLRESIEP